MNNSMDSYILEKNGFEKDNADLLLNETLFHNANGYQGVRGNFEEGYPEGMIRSADSILTDFTIPIRLIPRNGTSDLYRKNIRW